MSIRGAIDLSTGNSTRYHSIASSPDFDLPDSDWAWVLTWAPAITQVGYFLSATGSYGVVNSINTFAYNNSSGYGCRVSNTAEMFTNSGVPPANEAFMMVVRRISGRLYMSIRGLTDPSLSINITGPLLSGAQPNSNGVNLGRRIDGNTTRYVRGRWFGAAFFPGAHVRTADINELVRGRPFESFPWYKRCVFHAAPLTADDPQFMDLTGRHIITRNGTGYGPNEIDDTVLQLKEPRDLKRIYRPLYGTPPVSSDVLNRGLSGIEHGVIASGGGGHSGLHPIDSGFIS